MDDVNAVVGYSVAMAIQDEAARDAEWHLTEHWPDREIPVLPSVIARRMGIKVVAAALPRDVSGLIHKEPNSDPVIYVSTVDSSTRQRFTVAHELGHFVRNVAGQEKIEFIDYRDNRSSSGTETDEVYANGFAAALLMPETEVRSAFKALDAKKRPSATIISKLATEFAVSADAMRFRLGRLSLVSLDRV